jgi:hypothetical protein
LFAYRNTSPLLSSANYQHKRKARFYGSKIISGIRDGVTGGWRKLRNEELYDLYSSPGIIRITKYSKVEWAGHVVRMGEKMNVYRLLVGKPEGKETARKTKT